jgi:hypothetical protein
VLLLSPTPLPTPGLNEDLGPIDTLLVSPCLAVARTVVSLSFGVKYDIEDCRRCAPGLRTIRVALGGALLLGDSEQGEEIE